MYPRKGNELGPDGEQNSNILPNIERKKQISWKKNIYKKINNSQMMKNIPFTDPGNNREN